MSHKCSWRQESISPASERFADAVASCVVHAVLKELAEERLI